MSARDRRELAGPRRTRAHSPRTPAHRSVQAQTAPNRPALDVSPSLGGCPSSRWLLAY